MTCFWRASMWVMNALARPFEVVEGWLILKQMRAHGRYLDAKRRREEPKWLRQRR